MGRYSIKELEALSGIKAHTLRIWEKRHQLISPKRTQTNIRYYSDDDLKKIIRVSVLNNQGVKISRIAELSLDELSQRVSELSETQASIAMYIDQLVLAMIDLEEEQFDKTLSHLVGKFGFERTVVEILYPFLERIGILWVTDTITPAQEHFISNLIRQKLIVAIDGLPLPPKTSRKVLLYLPENELHELSLLLSCYIAKKLGYRTYYLGQNVPYVDLQSVFEVHKPDYMITVLTNGPSGQSVPAYLLRVSSDFPSAKILVSGKAIKNATEAHPPSVYTFDKPLSLKGLLKD